MWTPPTQLPTIRELVEYVKEDVSGLDDQLRRLCTAVHRHLVSAWGDRYDAPANVIVIGPTGQGKTWTVRRVCEAVGLPFIEMNATQFSEVGYRGRDLAWMFNDVIVKYVDKEYRARQAIADFERWGVVILDEFDKWRNVPNPKERQPGFKLQAELLKIVEGDTVIAKQSEDGRGTPVETGRIMFIALGAFEGLDKQMQSDLGDSPEKEFPNRYLKAEATDLMKYGFMQELMGRFPVILPFPPLKAESMVSILHRSVWPRYAREAADMGVELVAEPMALVKVAQDAMQKKIGARAFPALLDGYLDRAWAEAMPGDRIVLDLDAINTWSPAGGGARLEKGVHPERTRPPVIPDAGEVAFTPKVVA